MDKYGNEANNVPQSYCCVPTTTYVCEHYYKHLYGSKGDLELQIKKEWKQPAGNKNYKHVLGQNSQQL